MQTIIDAARSGQTRADAAMLTPSATRMGRYLRRRLALFSALLVVAAGVVSLQIHRLAEQSGRTGAIVERLAGVRFQTVVLLGRLHALNDTMVGNNAVLLSVAYERWRKHYERAEADVATLCGAAPEICIGFVAVRGQAEAFDQALGRVLGANGHAEPVHVATARANAGAYGSAFVTAYDEWIRQIPPGLAAAQGVRARQLLSLLVGITALCLLAAVLLGRSAIRRMQRERSALDRDVARHESVAAAAAQSERAVAVTGRAGQIEWVNVAFGQLFDVEPDMILGASFPDFFGQRIGTESAAATVTPFGLETGGEVEVQVRIAGARTAWLRVGSRRQTGPAGEHRGYAVVMVDVTEERLLRDKLDSEHELIKAVIETLPTMVFWKDLDLRYLGCNTDFARRFGYDGPEQMIGRTIWDLDVLKEWKETTHATDERALREGCLIASDPYEVLTRDGVRQHLIHRKGPMRDRTGKICGIVGVISEVTSVVDANRRLAEVERRWDLALQGSGVGVWDWVVGQPDLYLSPCWKGSLGYTDAELGNSIEAFRSLVHPADLERSDRVLRDCLDGERTDFSIEQRLRHRDGSYRWFLVLGNKAPRSRSGEPLRMVGTTTDITDLKRAQSERAAAGKMEAIGELAAGVAHEINTPSQFVGDNLRFLSDAMRDMTAMIASIRAGLPPPPDLTRQQVQQLLETGDFEYLREECPKAIEQSIEGIARISAIVRALKELSHPGQEKVSMNLNHVVESAVTLATNEWKYVASVDPDLAPDLPAVIATPSEIQQVIVNLLVNAAHAIEAVPRAADQEKGLIRISTRHDEDWVELRVADNGCGIAEEIRSRIFDPFFTTKPVGKGTGQGLAIVQSIVARHGGTLGLDSVVGQGTAFIVRLPVDGTAAQRAAA